QEQLAEQLYVSRTAISKWESGKGYPNIESLKCISKFFSVTIDELLSGEELITLAETENRSNLKKIYNYIYGILDIDRKSTRLNSSHVSISYAVFCLKKKQKRKS